MLFVHVSVRDFVEAKILSKIHSHRLLFRRFCPLGNYIIENFEENAIQ